LGKQITVIPDQDRAGLELVDRALELGWAVSIPNWPDHIKDVNDAVIEFGKLATMLTIFQSRETSKIKIQMRKKWLEKKLKKS
jgi:DNA primase